MLTSVPREVIHAPAMLFVQIQLVRTNVPVTVGTTVTVKHVLTQMNVIQTTADVMLMQVRVSWVY